MLSLLISYGYSTIYWVKVKCCQIREISIFLLIIESSLNHFQLIWISVENILIVYILADEVDSDICPIYWFLTNTIKIYKNFYQRRILVKSEICPGICLKVPIFEIYSNLRNNSSLVRMNCANISIREGIFFSGTKEVSTTLLIFSFSTSLPILKTKIKSKCLPWFFL